MITVICIISFIGVGMGWRLFNARSKRRGKGISLLVPFYCMDKTNQRWKNWEWLRAYWEYHLPEAEIIIGNDYVGMESGLPFSKSAVNNAASRASGDVFVIVDADGYISVESVLKAVNEIREAESKKKKLWFVPYRNFYRLTPEASQLLLNSSPKNPYPFPEPPNAEHLQVTTGHQQGHWFGAVIQIMSRRAFEEVGGFDTRFRGWGGEDHAFLKALDTLYWPHKTINSQVLHVWHPMFSPQGAGEWVDWKNRMWEGQLDRGANDALSGKYYKYTGDIKGMRELVNAGLDIPEIEEIAYERPSINNSGKSI